MPPRDQALASGALVTDPEHVYDLPDLIDLAERANPETRRAWEEARAQAARLGRTEGAYFPTLAVLARAGWSQIVNATRFGTEIVRGPSVEPNVTLAWLLVDFGRRRADMERAEQELLASNFAFNRRHQEVAFAVADRFYGFDASEARVAAAEATLTSARALLEAAEARRTAGLATEPEVLLARQEDSRAAFELQDAKGGVEDARAALAESLGIPPTVHLRVSDLGAQPLPEELPETVEHVIDAALAQRPDLAARLAALRAREAEIRRARAEFLPRVGVTGGVGGVVRDYRSGPPFDTHSDVEPVYEAFFGVEWTLFDGFQRENTLREAEAGAGIARADLAALELRTLREVWKSYADVKTALRKLEYARALLRASEDAYAATLESYRAGLGSFLDLLAAERDLARARMTHIQSRADVLTSSAALAFAAGGAVPGSVTP
jgi:outer membrane protein TolC